MRGSGVFVAAGLVLLAGMAPATGRTFANDPMVSVACVTDTAEVVSVDVPASQAQDAIRTLPLENPCDVAAIDTPVHAFGVSNDPQRSYAFDNVTFEDAWYANTGTGIIVAVVDTGVQADHPDLAGQLLAGETILSGVSTPNVAVDGNGHGTHVSGIIAALANNATGVTGAAPGVQILPVKAMGDGGSGLASDVAAGIDWAVLNHAKVINLSLGSGTDNALLAKSVSDAIAAGVVVVAAAGNDNNALASYPAAYDGVIGVASVDSSNMKSSFSNFGASVDLAAPGSLIKSTWTGGTYANDSGTSMASPFVAAAAALAMKKYPLETPAEITTRLENSAKDLGAVGRDDIYGYGLVDPSKALCAALCTPPTVTTVAPASGTAAGGTSLTITGTDLTNATAVTIGGLAATSFSVASRTSITATSPAHDVGVVAVAVTTPAGTGTLDASYTYTAVPAAPAGGGGGAPAPAAAAATSSAGAADWAITQMRPAFGPISGGTHLTILGYGFNGAKSVTIGGTAVGFRYVDSSTIEVVTPPGELGFQTVIITLPIGDTKATFKYEATAPVQETTTSATSAAAPAAKALAPAAVRAASARGLVQLAWTDRSPVAPVRQYVTVYRNGDEVRRVSVTAGATRTVVRRLVVGASYRFTVTVVGADGQSDTSPVSRRVRVAD